MPLFVSLARGPRLTVVIPFMGLAVASAPGFASYLGFLKPLTRSDGFGTGVVESLVPAIAIILHVSAGIALVQRE